MLRAMLLSAAAFAKTEGILDRAVRYNPLLGARVARALAQAKAHPTRGPLESLRDNLAMCTVRAAHGSRYGRGRAGRIEDWPLLDKATVRVKPEEFVSRSAWIKLPSSTGGTTGTPLKLWRSLECIVAEQMFIDTLLAPYGFSMRNSRVAVLRGDKVKDQNDLAPPFGRVSHGGKRLTLSSAHLTPQSLPWFEAALRDFAPEVLWVYPSAALNLLTLVQKAGIDLHIPVILASSEMLPAPLHTALADCFRSQIVNYYGQAERLCLAYSTKPNEFFFHPAYGQVELIPQEGDAETAAIVATNYWNLAMPLLRYQTGDLAQLPPGSSPRELVEISLGMRAFPGIQGREGEYLITRDGMRIIGLNQIPREILHVYQLQLVQTDPENLYINVAAMPGYGPEDAAHILENARIKIPASIKIQVREVQSLIVNARGKALFVVREFD